MSDTPSHPGIPQPPTKPIPKSAAAALLDQGAKNAKNQFDSADWAKALQKKPSPSGGNGD